MFKESQSIDTGRQAPETGGASQYNPVFKFEEFENKRLSQKDKELIYTEIDSAVQMTGKATADGREIFEQVDYYNKTTHDRNFFTNNRNGGSVAEMLFNLPEYLINSKECKKYLAEKLNNKVIYLFGGGDSIHDLLTSKEFEPELFINFDKYLKDEDKNKSVNSKYHSYPVSASDPSIRNGAINGTLPKADEIWATYSVPFYLDSSNDIKGFFSNIMLSLNEGGTARIHPLTFQYKETKTDNFLSRKKAFMDIMKELMKDSNYNVKIIKTTKEGHTLIIQKLKTTI